MFHWSTGGTYIASIYHLVTSNHPFYFQYNIHAHPGSDSSNTDGSQFLLNCTDLNVTQLKTINMARSVAGATCTLMVSSILIHILIHKAFASALQRLFLYLVLATILQEALIAISFEHQFVYPGQEEFCTGYGFIIQWSGVVMFNFALGIMLYLLYLVYVQLRGEPFARLKRSKRGKKLIECIYVLFVLIFPLTYLWIPFLHGNYGLSGASCWMRALDDNCNNVGLADQLIFAYGSYEGVGAVAILVTVGMVIIYCRIATDYPDARQLIKRTLLLMVFLFAYIIVISIPLAVRLNAGITGARQHFILWITWAIAIPISHTIFIFGFLFSFYSVRVCGWAQIKRAGCWKCDCCRCRKRTKNSHEVLSTSKRKKVTATFDENTIPPSDRVSPPSQSYFSIPYTDGFRDICSRTENDQLVSQHDKDTGYSSIAEITQTK